jgi:hypothetical protein
MLAKLTCVTQRVVWFITRDQIISPKRCNDSWTRMTETMPEGCGSGEGLRDAEMARRACAGARAAEGMV